MSEAVFFSSSETSCMPPLMLMPRARAISSPKVTALCVAVCELVVRGVREEQFAPIGGQRCQGFGLLGESFADLVTQQAAKSRADLGQLFGTARRDGLPAQKELEQSLQAPDSVPACRPTIRCRRPDAARATRARR